MNKPIIAVLGSGLGGTIAAFEVKEAVGSRAEVHVVSQGDTFHFVPSNPWVAVSWREQAKATSGTNYGPYIGTVMLLIGVFFVWRSFYGMRIPRDPELEVHEQPAVARAHRAHG